MHCSQEGKIMFRNSGENIYIFKTENRFKIENQRNDSVSIVFV